jgi:hypothetical protein
MSNFTPVCWLDTWKLACSLEARWGLFDAETPGLPKTIMLRAPRKGADPEDGAAYVRTREFSRWEECRNVVERIRRIAVATVGEIEFGRIFLELLPAGAVLPWERASGGYAEKFLRAHLALRSNPQAIMLSGIEGACLLPGNLTIVSRAMPCSAINLGQAPRVHLVADWRRKADDQNSSPAT